MATFLQNDLFTNFLYPFLLMFFILFGILEKTEILGKDKKQFNAGVSLVVGLIFVGTVFPKMVAANMILFMTVGLVIILVSLILWGFVSGGKGFTIESGTKIHKFFAFLFILAFVSAVLWATGLGETFISGLSKVFGFLFDSSWSGTFWMNVVIVVLVAVGIAVALEWNPFNKKSEGFMKVK
jgi:hypothetical protein